MDQRRVSELPEGLRKPPGAAERLVVATVGAIAFFVLTAFLIIFIDGISIPPTVLQSVVLLIGSGVGAWLGYRYPEPIADLFSSISIGR